MEKRRFDWKMVIVVVVASTVFIGAVLFLHRWQRSLPLPAEAAAITSTSR